MKVFLNYIVILLVNVLLITGCKKEEPIVYVISDLRDKWEGYLKTEYFGGDNDGLYQIQLTGILFFHMQYFPNLVIDPAPEYQYKSAIMDVSPNGDITGIFIAEHETEYGTETTTMNWSGCKFISRNEIRINMTWTWTNPLPDEGYYKITGTLTRKVSDN